MSVTTRLMAKKQEMAATSNLDSQKLDDLLTKMDALLEAKNDMLTKLNKLEKIQGSLAKDVDGLKESLQQSQQKVEEKADRTDVDKLRQKMEDLENRSKRNNIVIWGVEEGSEKDHSSMEEFIDAAIFQGLMNLGKNIEVMRAHRTNIHQDDSSPPKPRPIHIYLLRYTDKVFILKSAASKLKDNKYKNSQLFVSDDVSKTVRKERAELRKEYLPTVKAKPNVQFAFIPWSVPAQILYKEDGAERLKSFKLPKNNSSH